ncbi:MAG: hypothetical protein RRB13_15170 [bacterium]|nr:hypothetical protein [bacterium]
MRLFMLSGLLLLAWGLSGCCPWCHHDQHPGHYRQGHQYDQGPDLGPTPKK